MLGVQISAYLFHSSISLISLPLIASISNFNGKTHISSNPLYTAESKTGGTLVIYTIGRMAHPSYQLNTEGLEINVGQNSVV